MRGAEMNRTSTPHDRTSRPSGRIARAAVGALVVLALLCAALVLPSFASASRPYLCQITGSAGLEASASECNGVGNTMPGNFLHNPTSLALDGSGDLWVDDLSAGLVDKFDFAGNYLAQGNGEKEGVKQWRKGTLDGGIAYGDTANLLYTGDEQHGVWALNGSDASLESQFIVESPKGTVPHIAVDNSGGVTNGDLYAVQSETHFIPGVENYTVIFISRVDREGKPAPFSGSASYIEGNRLETKGAWSLATDSVGDLYVINSQAGNNSVEEFAPSGLFLRSFDPPVAHQFSNAEAVAVDPTNGRVLVVSKQTATVFEFAASGAYLGQIDGSETPAGSFSEPQGIAVDATGRLYVSDTGHRVVDVFKPLVLTPKASTGNASLVAKHTATLNGTVNPEGILLEECVFEYGETKAYGHSVPCAETPAEIGNGTEAVEVHADLTGLSPASAYHFRLKAKNASGTGEGEDEAFQTLPAVKLSTGEASEIGASTATLNGTVDPEGELVSDCHFAYGEGGSFDHTVPCTPAPGAGTGNTAVQAEATGLIAGHLYAFRLIATNAGGTTEGTAQSFETPPAVKLETGEASEVTSTTATINGTVNPQGQPVSECSFEYGTNYIFDHNTPCAPAPGEAGETVEVHAGLTGLIPGETYEFRLAAANAQGRTTGTFGAFTTSLAVPSEASCPNAGLRTGASAGLPDCRAYELVSPPDKRGADIAAMPSRTRVSVDGSAVQYMSLGGFADAQGGNIATEYMALRTAAAGTQGWVTHAITPNPEDSSVFEQISLLPEPSYRSEFSPDLSKGIFFAKTDFTHTSPEVAEIANLYLRTDLRSPGPGNFQLLSACPGCTEALATNPKASPFLAGASADFSHVIFQSEESLTSEVQAQGCTPTEQSQCPSHLYESDNGTVRLAGILPTSQGGGAAPDSQAGRGAGVVGVQPQYTPNAISTDGSRIEFTVKGGHGQYEGRLYQRIDNGLPDAHTVQINASERTVPAAPGDATYWGASPDGTRVFFTTGENLIDADTQSSGEDLYMWSASSDAQGHHLTLISRDQASNGAKIDGVIGTSSDARTVYFLSSGQLLSGQPGCDGGHPCIFRWHDGVLHYVAPIFLTEGEVLGSQGFRVGWAARVSSDGTRLLFHSAGTVGLPHTGTGDTCREGQLPCLELFLYDATANGGEGAVTCVSCQPGDPEAPAHFDAGFLSEVGKGGAGLTSHLSHPLSADGRFVFFNTVERLLPQDTNGVSDVYEYDSLTGELHLISGGDSKFGSYFNDASPDGSNVFFVTGERLTGWDVDGSVDLYDARIDGGVPDPVPPAPGCVGDTCQPPPASLNDPTPSSSSFAGPQNPVPLVKPLVKHKRKKIAKRHHKRVRHAKHNRRRPAVKGNRGGTK
jgi:hypothetical protein